ncbi:MAG: helix-turn-helix transcriptional regulator, partial [Christensenellaceae bacterium]
QEQLGEIVGVSNKTISRWETGAFSPGLDQIVFLADYYQVGVNEILAGKRIGEESVREESESNVRSIAAEQAQWKKRLVKGTGLTLIVAALCFLSAVLGIFFYARYTALYPVGLSEDGAYEKTVAEEIVLLPGAVGGETYVSATTGRTIRFALPEGFQKAEGEDNLYVGQSSSFLAFLSYKADDQDDGSLRKELYAQGYTHLLDRILFAYRYDLTKVSVFSGDDEIEMAAGVRRLRDGWLLPNEKRDGAYVLDDVVYPLTGNLSGFAAYYPLQGGDALWSVYLQDGEYFWVVNLHSAAGIGKDLDALCVWLGSVEIGD